MNARIQHIKELKEKYKEGMKIRLIHMADDPQAVPDNTIGTIFYVDDIGQIHVNWETGSTLAIIPEIDEFELIQ